MHRRLGALLLLVATLVAAGGCGRSAGDDDGAGGGKLRVVVSLAPLAHVVRQIGGDRIQVDDLTPAGGEAHDLELSTDDVDLIEDADLVLYVGGDFQPAVERAVGRAERAVDALELSGGGDDPHFWLDPERMATVATALGKELGDEYETDAERVAGELRALGREMELGLADCERRLLVTAHRAFALFAERYRLEQVAIAANSAEEEPDADRIAKVADLVRARGATTVFGEPGTESDAVAAVAREAGVRAATLDPGERRGTRYTTVMRANLRTLREGLGCR